VIDRDRKEFTRLVTKLAAVFAKSIDGDLVDSYFEALKPLSLQAVERACRTATADAAFFPKPVELRSMAAAPERPRPREIDGEEVFEHPACRDSGIVLTERFRDDGQSLGTFASPCICPTGESVRRSWQVPNSQGSVMAETAKENTRKLRDLMVTKEPAP